MKRPEIANGGPKLPSTNKAMLPVHLPNSSQLPAAPMMPVAPVVINESLAQLASMAQGRAMDFKLMVQMPDGSQYYVETSMDK